MKFFTLVFLILSTIQVSCKRPSNNKLYYKEAIGDREQGPLKTAVEIDEYLALYEHLSSNFLQCRDYKTRGDCKEKLDYEMDLSEEEKKRLWLYNLQKAQSIVLDENTPENIRMSAQVAKIDNDLKEAERLAGPYLKREKEDYFSVLIGNDPSVKQLAYIKSLTYARFLKQSQNKEMEIDKQIALLGLINPEITKMEGKGESSRISEKSLTVAGEINSAIATNLAYLDRKRLQDKNSKFYEENSKYFQAYIIEYAKMIKTTQQGSLNDEAKSVLEVANHPKLFADHILDSMAKTQVNEENGELDNDDIREALKSSLLKKPDEQYDSGLQLRNTVQKITDIWRSAYKVYDGLFNKGVVGGAWFIFYVGKMALDNSERPPQTMYEKYILTTQSIYAFTSSLELYKLFNAVLPTKVTKYVIDAINTSSLGVTVNSKLSTMARYAVENVKNTLAKVASGLSNFQAATLSQKITFALNTLQVLNAVAYFLGGLYTAYSSYQHLKAGEVIKAGLDVGTSALYFFAAAAQVAGVLFAVPGAQPLAIIFATVGFVLQIVKWFLPKTPHPLAVFLSEKVHPNKSYFDEKNCSTSRRAYYDCGNVVAALSKQVGKRLVKTPTGFGGTGGKPFDDHKDFKDPVRVDENTRIRRIALWSCAGNTKTGFEVFYNRGDTEYAKVVHGCDYGYKMETMKILDIAANEELSSVTLHKIRSRRNYRISGFEFCKTKIGESVEKCVMSRGLSRSGKSITYTPEAVYNFFGERKRTKGRIVGFFGKSGASIDNLGVYVAVDSPAGNRFLNSKIRSGVILKTVNTPGSKCLAQFANPTRFFGNPNSCSTNTKSNLWTIKLNSDSSIKLIAEGKNECLSVDKSDMTPRAKLGLDKCEVERKDQNLLMYETTGGFKLKFNHSELCVGVEAGKTARQVHCGSSEATIFNL